LCKSRGQFLVAASTERVCRRPFSEGPLQACDATALLINADPERPILCERCRLARQLRDLLGIDDVAGEVDDAAEIELCGEAAKIVRYAVAGEPDDRQTSNMTTQIAKRHSTPHYNARVRLHSSAPTRIDLAGGTYDIWPLYLFHENAQTINAALSLRAECTIESRHDRRVVLVSEDTGERVEAESIQALGVDRLPLV